ncbi:MAG: hypothetical protein BroJett026_28780 [Betaproteobacteria bacterium]|nr:MAG: hypothetical protein BroJett026_28780 [Betaproteobacteria bacterium]
MVHSLGLAALPLRGRGCRNAATNGSRPGADRAPGKAKDDGEGGDGRACRRGRLHAGPGTPVRRPALRLAGQSPRNIRYAGFAVSST